jgi:hypothetical protein
MESVTLSTTRRRFCLAAAASPFGLAVGQALGDDAKRRDGKAKSLILLWLDGAPSQLETFDPHPGAEIGGPTRAIETTVPGLAFAHTLPKLAQEAQSLCVVRSLTSKEGDHDRARYFMKTGYRPIPSIVHPALGAVCGKELSADRLKLPPYISLLGKDERAGGGYLGDEYDPFVVLDVAKPVPDLSSPVGKSRRDRRFAALDVIEKSLSKDRPKLADRTNHGGRIRQALELMDSPQVAAFDLTKEPESVRRLYGESPFGNACLAARRLVEAGVPCVEVQLRGWDSHANNFNVHDRLCADLDPGISGLIADLRSRGLLDSTLVVCLGEFGRTPTINGVAGRDHWNTGFSAALAGGGTRAGMVYGKTSSKGSTDVENPIPVPDFLATILTALGIDLHKEYAGPLGRPMKICEGTARKELLA